MGVHQTKKFMNNKMKTQHTECEIIIINHASDKELMFKIYEVLIQLNNTKKQIIRFKNRQWT